MDLKFQIDRIPPEGLDLSGHMEAPQLEVCLNGDGDTGFAPASGADIDLHIDKIENAIRISGRIVTGVKGACARCLEEARVDIASDVDMTLFPAKAPSEQAGEDDLDLIARLDDASVQSGVYSGPAVDATETVRELILLELPMRPLCSDSCAGLCDLCGRNLNQGPCGCVHDNADPRWEKLKEFKVS